MGSLERRDRERTDTRQRILDAARDLFVENGYQATTMRAIADRIEFTPTAIYHHFKNKEELLHELCDQDFRSLAAAFFRIGRIEDPVERLVRIGAAYVDFAIEHPRQYRFMFMTDRPPLSQGETARRRGDPGLDAYGFLRESCAEAIRDGRFRSDIQDPDELAQMLWAGSHGIVGIRIAKQDKGFLELRDTRKTAAKIREVMMRGLLAESPEVAGAALSGSKGSRIQE
jgi:AcrR family transcriptional regulator